MCMDGGRAQKHNSYFRNASDLVDPPLYVVSQNLGPCHFLEKLHKNYFSINNTCY